MKYIDIEKDKIPYSFEIVLANETFQFEVLYNSFGDFFTLNLYKNHNLILYGEKIVLGVSLFENCKHLDIPKIQIMPFDTTENAIRIFYENMNEDVFLYVLD
ncbi:hypothetical protein HMPREF3229_00162 [Peptoniphilus harei]|uniref:Cyanophage baseplate Pam3 plug gp18 domain-containing protein n=1 Tax=Peptoniphilus harei TaxID=54005 RepID=A0A133PS25_9FIRM|nr:hypothetical protein [Peptoniphilus harei]KXA31634.1 hypothetical protein HMPREF3229_00162 [Peptoniphilus harei]